MLLRRLLMMELDAMRMFVEVAEQRSFSRAAARCGVSQSAISQRVAALEAGLGVRLLDRSTRPSRLTAAGEALLVGAREMVAEAGRLEKRVRAVHRRSTAADDPAEPLRVAAIYSAGLRWLRDAVADYAGGAVELSYGGSDEVEQRVRAGDADLAIVSFPDGVTRAGADDPDWAVVPLREERMALVCPPGDPLAREASISARHLRRATLLGFTPDMRVGRETLDYLERATGHRPRLAHAFDNMDTLRAAVIDTGGVAILPQAVVEADRRAGRLAVVELEPEFTRPLGAVGDAARLARPDARAWLDHLADTPLAEPTPPRAARAGVGAAAAFAAP